MFWERFKSSIVLIIIAAAALIMGDNVLFAVITIISLIGLNELFKVYKTDKSIPGIVGYIAAAGYMALVYMEKDEYMFPAAVAFMLVVMAVYVLTFPKFTAEQIMPVFFGVFYVVVMLSFIYRVRMLEAGEYTVWLAFIGSWGSDTCAYLVGRKLGKKKIAPELSPKKTLEGCIGGIAGAALLGFIFALVFGENIKGFDNPAVAYAIIGAASSVISQIGDLAASAIKRNHDIKDYGKLIPGHGGILDRFDSIIFTAPIVYYLAMLLA